MYTSALSHMVSRYLSSKVYFRSIIQALAPTCLLQPLATNLITQTNKTITKFQEVTFKITLLLPPSEYRDTQPWTDCPTRYYCTPTNPRRTCQPRQYAPHTNLKFPCFSQKPHFIEQTNPPTCRTNQSGTRARANTARPLSAGMSPTESEEEKEG